MRQAPSQTKRAIIVTLILLASVIPVPLIAQNLNFPDHDLAFSLPDGEHWENTLHEVDNESLRLDYQSPNSTRNISFLVSSGSEKNASDGCVKKLLNVRPGRVLSEASGRLDQLPAKRLTLEHLEPSDVAQSLVVIARNEERIYAVSLSSSEGHPLEDAGLRSIGASIEITAPTGLGNLASDRLSESWQAEATRIQQRYGVTVVFDDINFPSHWRSYRPHFQIVPESKRLAAIRGLDHDLSHYEPQFVQRHLKKVFLYSLLRFRDSEYGGTYDYSNRSIYLHINWTGDDGSHNEAMGFHHEFSSIILEMYKSRFPENRWRSKNPRNFTYAFQVSSGQNLRTDRTELVGNHAVYSQGFMCSYGQLTLEDDVNTFAQVMIAQPARLEKLASDYKSLRDKANLLRGFYSEIGYKAPN